MILKETLQGVVNSQKEQLPTMDTGVVRDELSRIDVNLPFAIMISGIRRCGKSTLLRQVMRNARCFAYFNFEDPRTAGMESGDLLKLDSALTEAYGKFDIYLLDEIQNINGWETFVRSMLDRKKHFVITGSNASLLSRELGTKLTGRHLRHELFPFSYGEFLKFTSSAAGPDSFGEYTRMGGFPEYIRYGRNEILQELLNDILARDIVVRQKLRNPQTVKEMALYLLSNTGGEFSYNKLAKMFNLGSTNSAIAYVSYLEDSYLLFTVSRFDYSMKKQAISPKKVYSIDSGLYRANSISFTPNKGRILENQVFLNMRRHGRQVYYYKGKRECDFVVREGNSIVRAIQVCYDIDDDNRDREIKGLVEAMETFGLKEGLLLTCNQEDEMEFSERKIAIKPVWKWFLEQDSTSLGPNYPGI
ncbi:MAG: ATP-binding protein [Thermoplasmata archaeon]|nr:ATP-binding protein [Candidatus Sysuiplasma jiujiangense]